MVAEAAAVVRPPRRRLTALPSRSMAAMSGMCQSRLQRRLHSVRALFSIDLAAALA